jgi:peptide deformylase
MKIFSEDPKFPANAKHLKILHFPNPELKKKSVPVEQFDQELEHFVQDMILTMYHAPGIGLAAAQVGVHKRLFVIDLEYEREKVIHEGVEQYKLTDLNPLVFINPIIKNGKGEYLGEEGCLSLPGIFDKVKRKKTITVEYQDIKGDSHSLEASDLFAACIQHENDHLDGKVFIENLSSLKLNFYRKKIIKEQSLR